MQTVKKKTKNIIPGAGRLLIIPKGTQRTT